MNSKLKLLFFTPIWLLVLSLPSCLGTDRLLSQIDELTRSIDHALAIGGDISASLAKLPDEAGRIIREDAKQTLDLAIAEAGLQGIALVDYTNRRIAAYLEATSKGLKQERERISKGGKPEGTIDNILNKVLSAVVPSLPPAIIKSVPDIVDVKQTGASLEMIPPEMAVRFYGWGLDNPNADFEVKLVGADGAEVDLRSHLTENSNYKAILNLSSLLSLPPKSLEGARIVFSEENSSAEANLYIARSEIPVRLMPPPPPVAPPQYKIRLDRIYARSTDDWESRGEPKVIVSVDGGTPKTVFNKYVHEGSSRSIDKIITFTNNIAITLIEQDGFVDPDEKIGPVVIGKEQVYYMTQVFEKDDEKFTITWSLVE